MYLALPDAIKDVGYRLSAIEQKRQQLADDDFASRSALLDEEHDLEAKLGELLDRAAREDQPEAEKEAASQTDITEPPALPDGGSR